MKLHTTGADMGEVPPVRSWSALRSLRSAPPGLATKEDRRRVLSSALEQAEQLYVAAERVGVATQPILLFYGLSQAGRAIAAVHALDRWQLRGHGIKIGENQAAASPLAAWTVRPGPGGSFGRMVEVLASSTVPVDTRMGDLWPLLTATARHPLRGSGDNRALRVNIDARGWVTGMPAVTIGGIPQRFAENVDLFPSDIDGFGADYSTQASALDRYLARYPTLSGRAAFTRSGKPIGLKPDGDGTCSVNFRWPNEALTEYPTAHTLQSFIGALSRGEWRVYPSLDGGPRPVHPLLVWWAVLFRLSMLARYEPEEWETMTNVGTSADAVPIEHLLTTAISSVPELIFHVLTRDGT